MSAAFAPRAADAGEVRGATLPVSSVDLAAALDAQGRYIGAAGLTGIVDTGAWTLVSDIASGEPPRFAPADAAPTSVGSPAWFGLSQYLDGTVNNLVRAVAVSGTKVFVGGDFTNLVDDFTADYLVMWDGSSWTGLGCDTEPASSCDTKVNDGALNASVYALAINPKTGDLYAGGSFTDAEGNDAADGVAMWRAADADWTNLNFVNPAIYGDSGVIDGSVRSLAADWETGELHVGGSFTCHCAGGDRQNYAIYFGSYWVGFFGMTNPFPGTVEALALSDTEIFFGGSFLDAGGIATADNVAKATRNGNNPLNLAALGSNGAGNGALNGGVAALALSGSDLYVGGSFTNAGNDATADYVARWSGSSWSGLGSNGAGNGAISGGAVYALAIAGSDLYIGGLFANAGGDPTADFVARWNGSAWSGVGSDGAGNGAISTGPGCCGAVVRALAATSYVFVGGNFTDAAGVSIADFIAGYGPIAGPAVQAPKALIKTNAQLGGTKVPLIVRWSASDPSGIASYRLQESVNGGSWHTITLPSPTQKFAVLMRTPGKTYRFRVRATNVDGVISGNRTGPKLRLLVRQEGSSSVDYHGPWTLGSPSYAYGGGLRYATSSTARASITFSARSIAWVSTRAGNRGKARIYVDGDLVKTVDLASSGLQPRRTVYVFNPGGGTHTLRITVVGTSGRPRVDLDAFALLR